MISIIIRTKNEERWINHCLHNIYSQDVNEQTEVIIVDNLSTDSTVDRVKIFDEKIKVINIKKFLPGKAINRGIRNSSGDKIVILSAHCPVPWHLWLLTVRISIEQRYSGKT